MAEGSHSEIDEEDDDEPRHPKHLNGCGVCRAAYGKAWTGDNELQARHRKIGTIYWFDNGASYIEMCKDHWAEVHRWLNGDAQPAQIEEALAFLAEHAPKPPAARPVLTLEAFA